MESNFIEISLNSRFIRRSYIKNDKKVYVFALPKKSIFYRCEIHIQEKFTSVRDSKFVISVPKDFVFNLLETEKVEGFWKTETRFELTAEKLKKEYIGGKN